MAKVSVGVPVYNGELLLRACLECLRTQTFKDIEILIFDNASTDATSDIAREYVTRDSRFHYFRQRQNEGAFKNFIDVLDAATGEHFLWRAHDDLSEANFIEVLHTLLLGTPNAELAAPIVITNDVDGHETARSHVPVISGTGRIARIRQMLQQANSAWLYGLWKTSIIRQIIHETQRAYPFAWASDPLMLFPVILDQSIVCTGATAFFQHTRARPIRIRPPASDMAIVRRAYILRCEDVVSRRNFSTFERIALSILIRNHASDRCFGRRKIARRYLREVIHGRAHNSLEDVTQAGR
ncbi:MAG TPA: glycosyltransferase family 2 protein [Parvibaculum sp.]